jgi:acyl-CoA dehydrogenase
MADFAIPFEWKQVIDATIAFCETEVAPLEKANEHLFRDARSRYDEEGRLRPEILELRRQVRRKSAENGFYTMFGPTSLGGDDLGFQVLALVLEAMYLYAGPNRLLIEDVVFPSVLTNGLSPVLEGMSDELRSEHLADVASGEVTLCFALTEPDAGSDIWNIRTRAERIDGGWRLTGSKQWITNAPYADYCMVFAITDPELHEKRRGGISAFWVPADHPGVMRGSVDPIMGNIGGNLSGLTFDGAELPEGWLLGTENDGLKLALRAINKGRIVMGAKCLGLSQWGLKIALEYARNRRTFGRRIGDHGQVQALIAESAIDIYGLKGMLAHVCWKLDTGREDGTPHLGALKETSIVKYFGTEMAFRVYDRCVQICGATGLSNELGLEEGLRWARATRIPDGTSEIQRRTIATQLLDGELVF